MSIGTRSLLFGVHQFAIHPVIVFIAWTKLYGFPYDPRLWVCFLVHDWGYFGKKDMDGQVGETHPTVGAAIVSYLFDWPRDSEYQGEPICHCGERCSTHGYWTGHSPVEMEQPPEPNRRWYNFVLFHSRFMAKKHHARYSRLCVADKYSVVVTPDWLYLVLGNLSGEIHEYMIGKQGRTPAVDGDKRCWHQDIKKYLAAWVEEHKDGKFDEWTGKFDRPEDLDLWTSKTKS